MTHNLLSQETSPYLRQHKDNPVHWRPWGTEAQAEARRADKPILLSVGYAACHWCHVMAHESFEDEAIAGVMNELFVNIKVDREERPDIDVIYQSALAMMGQQGGWPLTMFLTPEGHPFWGGTYFPPEPRYGRPGFADVLRAVAETYRSDPERVNTNVTALRDALAHMARPPSGRGLNREILNAAAAALLRMIDPLRGGTAGAPKFPQPMTFRALWRAYKRTGTAMFRDSVTITLDHVCQGGIYDHVGGGFARYATDADWLVPHFEKMLYDNALLVDLMTEVWTETASPLYARRVRETVDWVLTDLRVEGDGDGFGLAGAFDADSEGVEGKYYVWTEAEIDALLGTDAPLFKRVYDVSAGGNWEGHTILNRRPAMALLDDASEAVLSADLARLAAVRRHRVPPLRDDKVLADWNGLMIAALARAGAAFGEPAWLAAARSVFTFVEANLQADGRLLHAWCAGAARHPATLDDYANMIRAALTLFEVTAERPYLDAAVAWTAIADRHYWDAEAGGYFLSADDTLDVVARTKTIVDNATPAGNGTMTENLARLVLLTGEEHFRERWQALVTLFSGDNPQYLVGIPGLLGAWELLESARQIVIIGEPGEPDTGRLAAAAFAAPEPLKVIQTLRRGQSLPPQHPAHGKVSVKGIATAYVCRGPTCGLPVTDPESLRADLSFR